MVILPTSNTRTEQDKSVPPNLTLYICLFVSRLQLSLDLLVQYKIMFFRKFYLVRAIVVSCTEPATRTKYTYPRVLYSNHVPM